MIKSAISNTRFYGILQNSLTWHLSLSGRGGRNKDLKPLFERAGGASAFQRSILTHLKPLHPPPPPPLAPPPPPVSVSGFVRDLPPESLKSTEDRCPLCLIKALPSHNPSILTGRMRMWRGMPWMEPMKAHIIQSHLDFSSRQCQDPGLVCWYFIYLFFLTLVCVYWAVCVAIA